MIRPAIHSAFHMHSMVMNAEEANVYMDAQDKRIVELEQKAELLQGHMQFYKQISFGARYGGTISSSIYVSKQSQELDRMRQTIQEMCDQVIVTSPLGQRLKKLAARHV